MAFPFAHDDLEKLKNFIDFVSTNPTILNMPQLEFVKKFIEKFGGKVPPGDFKMPEGKCPFGGDGSAGGMKAEASEEPTIESEPEEEEMESESEPELDMEVRSRDHHDEYNEEAISEEEVGNAIFLTEAAAIIKTPRKTTKTTKNTRKCIKPKKEIFSECDDDQEEEYMMNDDYVNLYMKQEIVDEDPINTSKEVNEENFLNASENEDSLDGDNDDDDEEYNIDDDEDKNSKKKVHKGKVAQRRNTRSKRKTKRVIKEIRPALARRYNVRKPKAVSCHDNCKTKCNEHFNKQQRHKICSEFWSLTAAERTDYLLQSIECRKITRRLTTRTNERSMREYTNRYFLKNSKGERTRVCINFFMSTLAIGGHFIRRMLEKNSAKINVVTDEDQHNKELEKQACNETESETSKLQGNSSAETEAMSTENEQPGSEHNKIYGWNKGKKLVKNFLPKPVQCDEKCKMKCTNFFTEEQRTQICSTFWTMDYKRRKDFVLSRVESRGVNSVTTQEFRKTNRAIRAFTNRYYLRGAKGENVRVCSRFFQATLCIGRHVVDNALRNADKHTGSYVGEDKRGRHPPKNKIPDDMLDQVKQHIASYPTWVPHKNHKTRFLHSSLNIRKMYNEYKQMCIDLDQKYVSGAYFGKVFHKDFRLAFLKPKSKHAHKVSAIKKEMPSELPKKSNVNISDYTGEEGGYWINANTTTVNTNISKMYGPNTTQQQTSVSSSCGGVDIAMHGVSSHIHIQENRQLHAPAAAEAAATFVVPLLPAVLTQLPVQQGGQQYTEQISQSNTALNNLVLLNYGNSNYDQSASAASVFRML